MPDELLNESLFFGLDHARQKVAAWAVLPQEADPLRTMKYAWLDLLLTPRCET